MDKKNRIIVFANQKGGVGKSTLCILMAHYLNERNEPVAIMDADLQQTIFSQRKRELETLGKKDVPWDVDWLDTRDINVVERGMKIAKSFPGTILIDAPGNLSDDKLLPIYRDADYIIVPMTYHPNVVSSTKMFAEVMEKVRKQLGAKFVMWFVPNKIDDRKKKDLDETKYHAWVELHPFGELLTRINDRAWMERTSTMEITKQQSGSVLYAFDRIITEIAEKENGHE